MRRVLLAALLLGACKAEPAPAPAPAPSVPSDAPPKREAPKQVAPPPEEGPTPPAPKKKDPRSASPHVAPKGKLVGKDFAPDTVVLFDNADNSQIGFYQRKEQRERWRCEEPLGESELQISLYRARELWKPGATIESEIDDWGATGIGFGEKHPGKAKLVLTKLDASTLALAGTIELATDDGTWKLAGEFQGEYCPSKVIRRDDPPPLLGMKWGLRAIDPKKISSEPVEAVIAGHDAEIAAVTVREVTRLEQRVTELVFFAAPPPDPCAERPAGGYLSSYADDGSISSREEAAFRVDSFAIYLAEPPKAGAMLAGNYDGDAELRTSIIDADLQVFEPDGYRSGRYAQYFSAALAIGDASDEGFDFRVYLALPDSGKSMMVGAFKARRCPALP